jgi:Fe2+ transport system protein B
MTNTEQKTVNDLYKIASDLRDSNTKLRDEVERRVKEVENKVEQKHIPVNLEREVSNAVQASISKAFTDALGGYNSPLQKYALNVVAKYQSSIEGVFDEVVKEAIKTDEFKLRVREVLLHKIAKTMISGIDGSVDKTINQMKQDSVFRSRLTLSVNALVDEFITQNKA